VLARCLHACKTEGEPLAPGPTLPYGSPFRGSDDNDPPPPDDEGVANWDLSVGPPSGTNSPGPAMALDGGCCPRPVRGALWSSPPPSSHLDTGVEEAGMGDRAAAVPSLLGLQGEQALSRTVQGTHY